MTVRSRPTRKSNCLSIKGYDYKFEFGDAGHNLKHGGAVFPDTMRWLCRDYPKDPTG